MTWRLLSIEGSNAPFTTDDLADAIIAANPQDDLMEDVEFVRGQVRRRVARVCSNKMFEEYFICDEMPDGRYVRHGVEVAPEEEILVCVRPESVGSQRTSVTALVKDQRVDSSFLSPDKAEVYAASRYANARRVDINELIMEYRARVEKSGLSFEARASMMR